MTTERKAEILDKLLVWIKEHGFEFIGAALKDIKVTAFERADLESETAGIEKAFDIALGLDDYELDIASGEVKIDKQVLDAFEQDKCIRIYFAEEDDNTFIFDYKMIREDDDYIYCEYLGK